jgi:putative NADH-flavin reductase
MKVLILGATGGSGLQVIEEALGRGHEVTALVRSPGKLVHLRSKITVMEGNLLNTADLESALAGNDVVLSTFGPRTLRPSPLWQQFGTNLFRAMISTRVNRLLLVSVALLFPGLGVAGYVISRTILVNTRIGAAKMEAPISASSLDWTIVRPPRLTNEFRTGLYRVEENRLPQGGFSISRADLAVFLLDEMERGQFVRKIVGVSHHS